MTTVPGSIDRIPELMKRLYAIVDELETLFPGRLFTLDGHLVGSIGEVWASYLYGVILADASTPGHDGRAPNGSLVQVKATQGNSIGLRSQPDHLLVLQLNRSGNPAEIYSGPGRLPWDAAGRRQSNGQRSISVSTLRELASSVSVTHRLPQLHG